MSKFLADVGRGASNYFKSMKGKIMVGVFLMLICIVLLNIFLNQS